MPYSRRAAALLVLLALCAGRAAPATADPAFEEGAFERTPDSWIAGEGDALPWMMISAAPAPGERYYGYRPDGIDVMQVESLVASVVTAAGSFLDCLEIIENPEDVEDQDIILYSAGVGRVQESNADGQIDLVSMESE